MKRKVTPKPAVRLAEPKTPRLTPEELARADCDALWILANAKAKVGTARTLMKFMFNASVYLRNREAYIPIRRQRLPQESPWYAE